MKKAVRLLLAGNGWLWTAGTVLIAGAAGRFGSWSMMVTASLLAVFMPWMRTGRDFAQGWMLTLRTMPVRWDRMVLARFLLTAAESGAVGAAYSLAAWNTDGLVFAAANMILSAGLLAVTLCVQGNTERGVFSAALVVGTVMFAAFWAAVFLMGEDTGSVFGLGLAPALAVLGVHGAVTVGIGLAAVAYCRDLEW